MHSLTLNFELSKTDYVLCYGQTYGQTDGKTFVRMDSEKYQLKYHLNIKAAGDCEG